MVKKYRGLFSIKKYIADQRILTRIAAQYPRKAFRVMVSNALLDTQVKPKR